MHRTRDTCSAKQLSLRPARQQTHRITRVKLVKLASMNNAIILHGCCEKEEFFDPKIPSQSNQHWFPWIQKQLSMKNIVTQTPEMPEPYDPVYEKWKMVMDQFSIDLNTLLVGHSCGAGFLLRWAGETKKHLMKLVLVAPWLDLNRKRGEFLDFQIEPVIGQRTTEMSILFSSKDKVDGVKESVEILSRTFPKAKLYDFENAGHFSSGEMTRKDFPELLKLIA